MTRGRRVVRRGLGFGGTLLATLFFCASMTPSLLPRTWEYQGVMGAVTAILGYGVGASAGAAGRAVIRYRPPARWVRRAWEVMLGMCAALTVAALSYSYGWQRDLRALMRMDTEITWYPPVILAVAAVLFCVFLTLARLVRLGGGKLIDWLDRYVPYLLGHAIGVLVVASLVVVFFNDVLFSGFVATMNNVSSVANETTQAGVRRPPQAALSGSPQSLVGWDQLGREGRTFTGDALTRRELETFSGRPAEQPIRAYVGLQAAPTPRARAELAVRELERTGAFERPVLAVLGATGTGWVDPALGESLEYMYNGDTALVAVQYSYLPSWVSFLADRDRAAVAGRALFDAVRARWERLPADDRPLLLVAGESLGAYAMERAFADLDDLVERADGALFVGPPHANPIWRDVTTRRDPGSPVWRPVYESGKIVRFAQRPADLAGEPRPRVVYLQNASDPVTWWTPRLVVERPQWLEQPRTPDINRQMNWFPLVTFWQVLGDMTSGLGVPPGHGHRYGALIVDGWAAVAAPPGWTAEDSARLRVRVSGR
ncbi:alpha/beta-hydrolase family protein [Nonomuraea sp. MCN248]|uniref:Alpha/beta-hydrolase family protein n=1 Tax=Nonomuraea corallina TaxID=2989783 RepID=A0ABT4S760_9ACTN|nr:alpha/beta-hydrolase family protein [Nonomuraea corallina]MDA0633010.1 alpha/beta-hydrolase family protein [Nonomuraea corallina]